MANLKLKSFCLLEVILSCICLAAASIPAGNETDRLALLAVKAHITHDPHRIMSSWNETLHHCHWIGVSCNLDSGRVIRLELYRLDLGGSIAPQVGNMSFLEDITLLGNNFTGNIPREIGRLLQLKYLFLYENALTGEIPQGFSSLPSLEYLSLHNNALEGKIPSNLSQYSSLSFINLSFNKLTGEVPRNLSRFSVLDYVDLSNNQLSGEISGDTGCLLRLLILSNNAFKGTIPKNLSCLSSLEFVDLSSNKLMGRIPLWVGHLSRLKSFAIHNNFLQGELPANFFDHSFNFEYVNLANNELTGEIPPLICNASQLQYMDLSHNNLTGVLPNCIANFSKHLFFLKLGMNGFHGNIPDSFMVNNSLWSLELNGNNLDGNLPPSLVNCQQLEVLNLGQNRISDIFPFWLETLPNLTVLILRSNKLHGVIGHSDQKFSFSTLRILDLSYNSFTGELPAAYFTRFMGMMSAHENISESQYMSGGTVWPYEKSFASVILTIKGREIQYYRILRILTAIDLSSNRFSGKILEVIGNLVAVKFLNLSHNSLVGNIPTSLANLGELESLDLSANNLVGQIPPQLARLTFLAFLNLSYNHLEGRIPQDQQLRTFENSSFLGNSRLCGPPLSNSCRGDGVPKPLHPTSPQDDGPNFMDRLGWKVVIVGYSCGLPFGLFIGYLMFLTQKPKWLVTIIEEEMHAIVASRRARKRGRRF